MSKQMKLMVTIGTMIWVMACPALSAEDEAVQRLREDMGSPPKLTPEAVEMRKQAAMRGETVSFNLVGGKANRLLKYAKENGIPLETVLEEAKAVVKSPHAAKETKNCMFRLLTIAGDVSSLPFLEEMSNSDDENIRRYAVVAYVNLAGVESVDFLRRMKASELRQAETNERYTPLDWGSVFSPLLSKAEHEKNTGVKDSQWNKFCVFLLEQIQEDKNNFNVEIIDSFLCEEFSDYATSSQREQIIKRFAAVTRDSTMVGTQRDKSEKGE